MMVDDALDERVREPLFDGAAAPRVCFLRVVVALVLDRLGERDQALGGVGAAIEQDVFDELEQVLRESLRRSRAGRR